MLAFSQDGEVGLDQKIDQAFAPISDFFFDMIFFQIGGIPFVLILLVCSAAFFTVYFKFINIRKITTAINVVRGKYDDLDHATVGDNNLAIDGDIVDTIRDESVFSIEMWELMEQYMEDLCTT